MFAPSSDPSSFAASALSFLSKIGSGARTAAASAKVLWRNPGLLGLALAFALCCGAFFSAMPFLVVKAALAFDKLHPDYYESWEVVVGLVLGGIAAIAFWMTAGFVHTLYGVALSRVASRAMRDEAPDFSEALGFSLRSWRLVARYTLFELASLFSLKVAGLSLLFAGATTSAARLIGGRVAGDIADAAVDAGQIASETLDSFFIPALAEAKAGDPFSAIRDRAVAMAETSGTEIATGTIALTVFFNLLIIAMALGAVGLAMLHFGDRSLLAAGDFDAFVSSAAAAVGQVISAAKEAENYGGPALRVLFGYFAGTLLGYMVLTSIRKAMLTIFRVTIFAEADSRRV